MEKKRTSDVRILGVLVILFWLFQIPYLIFGTAIGGLFTVGTGMSGAKCPHSPLILVIASIIYISLCIISIVAGIGIIILKSWGRKILLYFSIPLLFVVYLLLNVISYYYRGKGLLFDMIILLMTVAALIFVFPPLLIFRYFLTRSSIKEQFR